MNALLLHLKISLLIRSYRSRNALFFPFSLANYSVEIHFYPFIYSTLISAIVRPYMHFLACSDHCADLKVGLVFIYLMLTQPVLSCSRFLLKDLPLVDGKWLKCIVPHEEEHSIAWASRPSLRMKS